MLEVCSGYVPHDTELSCLLDPACLALSRPGGLVMRTRPSPPYRHQGDLFEKDGRLPTLECPVCNGRKTVPFWSRQGKVAVIGGKQVTCESCNGTGRMPAP